MAWTTGLEPAASAVTARARRHQLISALFAGSRNILQLASLMCEFMVPRFGCSNRCFTLMASQRPTEPL